MFPYHLSFKFYDIHSVVVLCSILIMICLSVFNAYVIFKLLERSLSNLSTFAPSLT